MSNPSDHLKLSRHGVWYYRWVVPRRVRALHPELPRELKRTTGTADIRHARPIARRFHQTFLLRTSHSPYMPAPLSDPALRSFEVEFDPRTGVLTKLNAKPDEMPAALEAVKSISEMMRGQIAIALRDEGAGVNEAKVAAVAIAAGPAERAVDDILLSQAFSEYANFQISNGDWTEQTREFTHEPTVRLFIELVGSPWPSKKGDGLRGLSFDLPVSGLTRSVMRSFLTSFWKYPARQGQRGGKLTARERLEAGDPPQSRANVFKRLGHIKQFLKHCVSANGLSADVLSEIAMVLAADNPRNREKDALRLLAPTAN